MVKWFWLQCLRSFNQNQEGFAKEDNYEREETNFLFGIESVILWVIFITKKNNDSKKIATINKLDSYWYICITSHR